VINPSPWTSKGIACLLINLNTENSPLLKHEERFPLGIPAKGVLNSLHAETPKGLENMLTLWDRTQNNTGSIYQVLPDLLLDPQLQQKETFASQLPHSQ
jgi:hypothetical protein